MTDKNPVVDGSGYARSNEDKPDPWPSITLNIEGRDFVLPINSDGVPQFKKAYERKSKSPRKYDVVTACEQACEKLRTHYFVPFFDPSLGDPIPEESPTGRYSFSTTDFSMDDVKRIFRESQKDGLKAFIIEGPQNALVAIRKDQLGRDSGTVAGEYIHRTWGFPKPELTDGKNFYCRNTPNAKKIKSAYRMHPLSKHEIKSTIEELNELLKPKTKIEVTTWK